ncbi:MAG TPA: glycosyltransferase [Gemmatimonadaceae bacterium]|nr:glycosyltransferase [Gemmatimonadaceae bacterium]
MTSTSAQPADLVRQASSARPRRDDFALIIPAFDEVENIPALFAALRETYERHGLAGEIILVDDGSRDDTFAAASREAARFPGRVQVLRHRRNLGKTEALLTGASAAERELLLLYDADLQHSPEEIPRFLAKLDEGWDIVTGRKIGAYEKRAVSSVYNRLSGRLFDIPVHDLNSMKAFRSEVLRAVPLRHDWHRFFVVLAHAKGFSVTEIDIALHPRHAGRSKYDDRSRILGSIMDLLVVWFYLRFSAKPMHLFGGAGAAMIVLGVVVGLIASVARAIGLPPPAFGYRPVLGLVILLVVVGVTLFGVGLLAEMIAIMRAEIESVREKRH